MEDSSTILVGTSSTTVADFQRALNQSTSKPLLFFIRERSRFAEGWDPRVDKDVSVLLLYGLPRQNMYSPQIEALAAAFQDHDQAQRRAAGSGTAAVINYGGRQTVPL
ncbi:hypothetical protein CHLRE_16g677653v5 [Chlamydomonas reinhardtii]|uniref:Uncharacterized protein n=1 Tax=Chlamydomonas reinhardtii TaxID=3055 RepID=A0A2K3CVW8_CHLRE|nr:uncharacterized protein CHLRE_16g677653v5 [Chlamydomonas reinhardtii]PNW72418.1 hypothetical protein CHLRE_16g677653v5 [Chlamydomonas reinhardtii]